MNDNDKTVKANSVPPMSSGTREQGDHLLQTGMMQPPQMPGVLGTIGKYQVIRILGEGGMGQVLLAREPVTDSLVAVKIIKPEYLKKAWAVHRFLTEARHIFKMSHPSIIRVLEVSDRPEGPYFVMPYMAGGSLAQQIKPGETLPPDTIQPLARQVAEALQYAHARGIIHRDLKTSNILLDPEGRAYLCDFGLLRTVFNDSMVDVTKPQVEGTVPYMSPAIAGGKAEDTRCDIYAFGCLLYEMLTGQPPYQGPTVDAILKQIQAGPPQPIRQLNPQAPARLVAIAEHAMGRELRDRYATMADVINDLDRAAQGKEPLGPHGRANGSQLRKKVLAAIGIVALIGLAAFGLSKLPGRKDGSLLATPQEQFNWTANNGAITITKYFGPDGAVTIPSEINGLPVTRIGAWAFRSCTNLTSVTIPNSITSIDGDSSGGAFDHCVNLTNVTIPHSVTNIGWTAFRSCTRLTSIRIPSSVMSFGKGPFAGCYGLDSIAVDAGNPAYCNSAEGALFDKKMTCLVSYPCGRTGSYTIPNGVVSIGEAAFSGSTKLTSVTIPESVANLGNWGFYGCTSLTNVYCKGNAPSGENIWSVFAESTNTTIYYLPGTKGWAKEFGGRPTAPWNPSANNAASPAATAQTPFTCTTNNGGITITKYTGPGGAVTILSTINGLPVTSIGNNAFRGSSLTSVLFPNGITSIGGAAFWGCANLTNVTIPNSVTSIGDWVFQYCSGLTSVTIPNSVTNIGQGALIRCSGLISISVDAVNPAYSSSADGVLFNKEKTCLVSYPAGKAGSYVIPNRVARIGFGAFDSCIKLTSVTIPNSVTNVGHWAFLSCISLITVTIPDGVTSIESRAFNGCTKLTSVTIPNSVTNVGEWAFGDCPNLTSVTIPGSVTRIANNAFENCVGLSSVTIGNSVTSIGDHAFYGCSGLSNVSLPHSVTSIGYSAFSSCANLTSITIPNTVTNIGNRAFQNCKLTSVAIPRSVTRIDTCAFWGCSSLTNVVIPSSVTSIGDYPFGSCSGLNSIIVDAANPAYSSSADGVLFNKEKTRLINYPGGKAGHYEIPSGVTRIAMGAFNACTYLSSVTIPESVTMIDTWALSGCDSLARIYFKGNAPWLGQDVFVGIKKATIYHLPEAKGWGPEFGGFPTALWNPEAK